MRGRGVLLAGVLATILLVAPAAALIGVDMAAPDQMNMAVQGPVVDDLAPAQQGDLQAPVLAAAHLAGHPVQRVDPATLRRGPVEAALDDLAAALGVPEVPRTPGPIVASDPYLAPALEEGVALVVFALADAARLAERGAEGRAEGALRVLEAVQEAIPGWRAAAANAWAYEDPRGLLQVGDASAEELSARTVFLLDLGGDDLHQEAAITPVTVGPCHSDGEETSCVAASVALTVDLGGHDAYSGSIAAARLGVAILVDVAGDDTYSSVSESQGRGSTALGALLDLAGADIYTSQWDSQGAGRDAGIGVLADYAGADRYTATSWSQGFGMTAAATPEPGTGLLYDGGGADRYVASGPSQGASDRVGHGALVEWAGNDHYSSSGPTRGSVTGPGLYVVGVGLFVDREGADTYAQAPGANGARWATGTGVGMDCTDADCNS